MHLSAAVTDGRFSQMNRMSMESDDFEEYLRGTVDLNDPRISNRVFADKEFQKEYDRRVAELRDKLTGKQTSPGQDDGTAQSN